MTLADKGLGVAQLTGSINDWSMTAVKAATTTAGAAAAADGFVLTHAADSNIQVHLTGTDYSSLSFSDATLKLSATSSAGTFTVNTLDTTAPHTIKVDNVATNALNSNVVLGDKLANVTVQGAGSGALVNVAVKGSIDISHADATLALVPQDSTSIVLNTPATATSSAVQTTLQHVDSVQFVSGTGPAATTQNVLIVGAGGFDSLKSASALASTNDNIFVADSTLAANTVASASTQASDAGTLQHANVNIFIASGDAANMSMAQSGAVNVFGSSAFSLTGSSGSDTIHDYTTIAATKTNTISGMDGADTIVVHNNAGTHTVSGGGGSDILIGGAGSTLQGGDGNDTLLAFGGAATLSGGAGDDLLFNASVVGTDGKAVTMIGGSGSDTFALIGTTDASGLATTTTGAMKTVIADLGTGGTDKIDLSFVEKASANTSIDTAANFTAAGGSATMTTAGTTLNFGSGMILSSSEVDTGDVNSLVTAGSMTLSNATLTKVATAINAGADTAPTIDFSSTFGHLTDTYHST